MKERGKGLASLIPTCFIPWYQGGRENAWSNNQRRPGNEEGRDGRPQRRNNNEHLIYAVMIVSSVVARVLKHSVDHLDTNI
ncbi:hypothetical protein R1flu_029263 [Riccia fluitans]|uniref:Uncharacterized protein n=1 Tax=Riccia fluitans TaxID=41844 RepID=A0ABD1XPM4_9MARC